LFAISKKLFLKLPTKDCGCKTGMKYLFFNFWKHFIGFFSENLSFEENYCGCTVHGIKTFKWKLNLQINSKSYCQIVQKIGNADN
jgi:hypothetical protein